MEIPRNKEVTYFAKTLYRDTEQQFGIKRKDRRQHMYVLGKSGTGKSALLNNMIIQNIANGEGVAVVDPHGELAEEILGMIPPERKDDVVYFNPSDDEYFMGFNVLEVPDPKYKHLIASGLMGIFTKIWANVWSSRMEYILNNCILALLDTPGTTMLGIPRILVDKDYRTAILENVTDPVVKGFWLTEYESWQDRFRNEAIAPIQNKVGQFLSSSVTRNIVGQAKSTIDIFHIMNNKKILIVNVSKGRVGEDNSALLGAMIITKIQLAAMERVRIPEDERKDFYLYVDEFQNFVTDSFASILSEARKYRLNLILAHQYIQQLVANESTSVRDAVFGNVGSMIVFRVGAADAEFIEKEFEPEFTSQDFVNLPNYHIYTKLMIDGVTSRPFSAKTLAPFKISTSHTIVEDIVEHSRRLYARPRAQVEEEIQTWSERNPLAEMVPDATDDLSKLEPSSEGIYRVKCTLFDECGNVAEVPFKPENGKPIYCRDHMQKIKEGALTPGQPKKDRRENKPERNDRKHKGLQPKNTRRVRIAPEETQTKQTDDKPDLSLKSILREALGEHRAKQQSSSQPASQPEKKKTPPAMSLNQLKQRPQPDTEPSDADEAETNIVPQKLARSASASSMNALQETLQAVTESQQKEMAAQEKILDSFKKQAAEKARRAEAELAKAEVSFDVEQKKTERHADQLLSQAKERTGSAPKEVPEDVLRKVLD